jgi:hypothetical protein
VPECAYTGYARQVSAPALFAAAARRRSASNTSAVKFAKKTGGSDEVVAGWASFDALTSGNMLEFGMNTTGSGGEDGPGQ